MTMCLIYLTLSGDSINAQLQEALTTAAVGTTTPQDRIRRSFSAPIFASHEKGSLPSKVKRVNKRKKLKTRHQDKTSTKGVPSVPEASHDAVPVPSHADCITSLETTPGEVEPPKTTPLATGAMDETQDLASASHGDVDGESKATAAKSMAKKPVETTCEPESLPPTKAEVSIPVPSKAAPPKKEEPQSVVRERAIKIARADGLARAVTRDLDDGKPPQATVPPDPVAPQPVPPAAPDPAPPSPAASHCSSPGPAASETAASSLVPSSLAPSTVTGENPGEPAIDQVERDANGRKKRRPKTTQEKANHARFVRFSRHIQST